MNVLFASRPADGEAVDLQRGDSDADWNALSVFAAGSDAFIELQIAAHHADARKHVGTIADESSVLQRSGDLAILDHVALGSGEDELAVGDINLAATEVHGVNATFHGADDVF